MSLKAKIEAVIYASEEPVTLAQLSGLLGHEAQAELDYRDSQQRLPLELEPSEEAPSEEGAQTPEAAPEPAPDEQDGRAHARQERERARRLRDFFRSLLDELIADYATPERGLEIREVASGFRLATKPEYHDAVRGFVKSLKPPLKLSLQALETLAVVAYKQPVTAPEISDIRGVDSGGVLGSLMARKLITTAGRKAVIGRPILYKTTRDFLLRFGLKDLSELPSIEEFEKMATELAEADPIQEEIPMPDPQQTPEPPANIEIEHASGHGIVEPQPDGDSTPLTTTAGMSPTPDGKPTEPPSERLSGLPPADVVPGTDDDPTEAGLIARQNDRDREERTFPQEGSVPASNRNKRSPVPDTSKNEPIASPHSPQDREPDTIATPEGDNEYPPDAPLQPTPDGLHTPPGLAPSPYDADKHDEEKPSGIVKFIDEVARGEYM